MKRSKYFITRVRRQIYDTKIFLKKIQKTGRQICNLVIPLALLACVSLIIYDFGFQPLNYNNRNLNLWLNFLLDVTAIAMGVRIVLNLFIVKKTLSLIFNVMGWLFLLFLTLHVLPVKAELTSVASTKFFVYKMILYSGIVLGFITEGSYLLQYVFHHKANPALLFVTSFAFLILIGAFLLQLPNATSTDISAVDALFTSASAVCVTGLIVVDTATVFTPFGQMVILILIQIGALGIMTFAGLLAYAVAGSSSVKSQVALTAMFNQSDSGNIIKFIYRVIAVTLMFEVVGAFSIYFSVNDALFDAHVDKIFFSVFHAVSAFSNAGFSTLTDGLYEEAFRFNYTLHMFVAVLIILGGIGFPIVFNIARYLRVKVINLYRLLTKNSRKLHMPRLIQLNSRLALAVTGVLLVIGFVAYLLFEQDATLAEHPSIGGKIVTAFFGSVTPRTAGFNTVNTSLLTLPMIMIYLLLMWIGASPGSTGGGIRTTTAGVAVLNMVSVLRGKDRTDFFRSEISFNSIRRAFAVILMSLLFIGFSVFFISINDEEKGLIKIAFESFSAFSTVGLSLGITADLTSTSKIVLIITMFVGRVGTVTLMVAFIRQSKTLYYRYPKEEVTL